MIELCFRKCPWFVLSLIVAGVALTSWRLHSDYLFYRHRAEFTEALSHFQGVLPYSSVKSEFSQILFNGKINLWRITPLSLLYPATRNVKAILVWPYSDCMSDCMRRVRERDHKCNDFCKLCLKKRKMVGFFFSEPIFLILKGP